MSGEDSDFCCSHSKKACVLFFTQSLAIGAVLIWSMAMLSLSDSNDVRRELYISMLSTAMGVFLPQPSLIESNRKPTFLETKTEDTEKTVR